MAAVSGVPVDLSPLDAAWENLLLLQFHDILPGSSIGEVYREAALDHARTAETARSVRDAAWRGVAERIAAPGEIVAFNSLSWPRSDAATALVPTAMLPLTGVSDCDCADAKTLVELVAPDGRAAPAQIIGQRDGQTEIVFTPDELPATGYLRLALRPAAEAAQTSLRVSPRQIENRFFRVELDDEGNIVRLLDKRHGREVVPAGAARQRAAALPGRPGARGGLEHPRDLREARPTRGSRGRRSRSSRPARCAPWCASPAAIAPAPSRRT